MFRLVVFIFATFFKDAFFNKDYGVFRMVFRNTSSLLSTSFFAIRMRGFALVVLLECCLLEQKSQQLLFATLLLAASSLHPRSFYLGAAPRPGHHFD